MGRSLTDLAVFLAKRLALLVPVVLGVVTLTFFFTHIAISNPCAAWVGPKGTPSAVQACESYFGLKYPLPVQYERYVVGLASGNWGVSLNGAPVFPTLVADFPATLELVLASLFLLVVIGIPLGVIAAASNGRFADHLVRIFYLSGWATPTYLAAAILAFGVGGVAGISTGEYQSTIPPFPQVTHMSVVDALIAGNLPVAGDALIHLTLPALALAFLNLGIVTRMTRTSMLESLPMDFVKTARMKGLSEFLVLYKHALRHSLITTTTIIGLTAGYLLGATVVVEEVFQWPGIGKYAFDAITHHDFAGALGVVVFLAIGVVIANLISDILYGVLDPRVEWR